MSTTPLHARPPEQVGLAARLDAALPQTQCTRCGYPDCRSYAQAIAEGQADIHQCPPGGAEGIARLAALTGRPARPLDPDCGLEGPRSVAVIDEDWCIGCTLCLDACPTDAIVGASKRMHQVIEAHCTGCELCLPVCPVDCIALENASGERTGWAAWSAAQANAAQQRYQQRSARLARNEAATTASMDTRPSAPSLSAAVPTPSTQDRQATIAAALARARQQRTNPHATDRPPAA